MLFHPILNLVEPQFPHIKMRGLNRQVASRLPPHTHTHANIFRETVFHSISCSIICFRVDDTKIRFWDSRILGLQNAMVSDSENT